MIFTLLIILAIYFLQPNASTITNDSIITGKGKSVVFIYGLVCSPQLHGNTNLMQGGSGTRGVTALLHSWGCTNVSELNFANDSIFVIICFRI